MKRELALQTDICKSTRKEGGWARKLSHQTMVGLPDLLLNRFPFVPMLIEVKDLGPCNPIFSRKVDVTDKQRYELLSFDQATWAQFDRHTQGFAAKRWSAGVLVGWGWGRERWLAMLPPTAERISVGHGEDPKMVHRQVGGYYPIGALMELFGDIHKVKLL